jgi:hypothetical protein
MDREAPLSTNFPPATKWRIRDIERKGDDEGHQTLGPGLDLRMASKGLSEIVLRKNGRTSSVSRFSAGNAGHTPLRP